MAGMENRPGFWAVLPAEVRYDKDLPASAKLLYAEISSLSDQLGYCYATNAYFEKLFGMSDRTVMRLIRALEEKGFVRVEDATGGKAQRKIFAGINPLTVPTDKNVYTPRQKCHGPPDKIVTQNNKNNNKYNNKPPKAPQGACAWEPEMFERFWKAYPCKKDKASACKEWDKLRPDRKLMDVMSAALLRAKASDEWQRGIGIPYACRWLSHRRWEDEAGSSSRAEAPPPPKEGFVWR